MKVAPRNIADRVCLGLLPSSEIAWETAILALDSRKGGYLHVHESVYDEQETDWLEYLIRKLHSFCTADNSAR